MDRMLLVGACLQIPLPSQSYGHIATFYDLMNYAAKGDEEYLDVVHWTLDVLRASDVVRRYSAHEELERHLAAGVSAWTATETGLVRRVDPTAQASFVQATSPGDQSSTELRDAWGAAYGRNPNASDAWDHAIKAAEAVLIPIVVPTQSGAHMGHVIGQLDHQGARWSTLLRFNQTTTPVNPPTTAVQALVGILRLLYPNPDRHVGPDHRVPTLEEARAVVQLAVTIVQWARDGQIARR